MIMVYCITVGLNDCFDFCRLVFMGFFVWFFFKKNVCHNIFLLTVPNLGFPPLIVPMKIQMLDPFLTRLTVFVHASV